MTTVTAPVWTPWTSYYDPAGQGPHMVARVAGDGSMVTYLLDGFALSLQGGQDASLADATGLSGALSVDVPADFDLQGFLLQVNGTVDKTARSEALVTCSIGHSAQSLQWPTGDAAEPDRSGSRADANPVISSDLLLECFTGDYNPANVGVAPSPPLPPIPITLSMQARCRTADEAVVVTLTHFTVVMLGSS